MDNQDNQQFIPFDNQLTGNPPINENQVKSVSQDQTAPTNQYSNVNQNMPFNETFRNPNTTYHENYNNPNTAYNGNCNTNRPNPVVTKKPEPVLVQKVIDNFPVFGLTSVLYAIFFCFCLYENFMSITSVLLCVVTIIYFLFWFKKLEIKSIKTRYFYIISICLLGLSNMLTASGCLVFLNDVAILLLWFCFLLRHFYDTSEWDFSKYSSAILQTIFSTIIRINYPFVSLQLFFKDNKKKKDSKLHYVFLGLLISIPLLLVVGGLLISADAVFRNLADNLFSQFFVHIRFDTFLAICILLFIGILGSYCTLIELCGDHISKTITEKKTMEPVIAITFTSVLTVIYLCFSLIQIFYLFIGNMTLPDGYTYANYAREGFFQLLFVCLINLVLVLFCMKHYRDNKILKIILTIICLCTYIMIASSTMRMILYVQAFCLTFLRIFVLVSLFALFLCLTLVVISIYKPELPLFSSMLAVITICFLAFSLAKPDAISASYNINQTYSNVDTSYLFDLSLDAVPALERGGYFDEGVNQNELDLSMNDSFYPENITEYSMSIYNKYNKMNLRNFNLSIYKAGKILAKHYN